MLRTICRGIPIRTLILTALTTLFFSVFQTGMSYYMSYVTIIYGTNDMVIFVGLFLIILFATYIVEVLADVSLSICGWHIEGQCRLYYLDRLNVIKPEILKKWNTGYISSLVVKLISLQIETLTSMVYSIINIVYLSFYTVILVYRHKYVWAIIAWSLFIVASVMRTTVYAHTSKYHKKSSEQAGIRDSLFIDAAMNINTVQRMSSINFIKERFTQLHKCVLNPLLKADISYNASSDGIKYLGHLWAPIILWISLFQDLSALDLSLIIAVSIQFPHNMRELSKLSLRYTKLKNVADVLDKIVSEDNKHYPIYYGEFKSAEIENLDYTYSDEHYSSDSITIHIPYFNVCKGDKICITGESGQGKTTLLNILSGEIETDKVLVNGMVTNHRLSCVFIAQDTEILDMSLRDNLLLGRDIPDDKLIYYLQRVGMGDWLASQREGLDTILGERGVFVSTGQRQRINIIRGLLMSEKEIYLLDEPTSNVDAGTEKLIVDLIEEILSNKTVIIVSHRPALTSICNKHYTMSGNNTLQEV